MSTTANAAAATAGGHDALNDAVMLERSKVSELHRLGAIGTAKGALPAGWAQQQVDAGTSVERARDALIEAIADVKEAEHGHITNHRLASTTRA